MQCLPRHQVDGAPEQVGKILRQVLNLPAERSPLSKFVEKIDIASWAILSTSDRTEDVESCNPEATTQRVQSRSVDVQSLHATSLRDERHTATGRRRAHSPLTYRQHYSLPTTDTCRPTARCPRQLPVSLPVETLTP